MKLSIVNRQIVNDIMIRKKLTPRQKMINLMYVVLMAMLALNVSSDVLEGFKLVDEGLNRTKTNSATQNEAILHAC